MSHLVSLVMHGLAGVYASYGPYGAVSGERCRHHEDTVQSLSRVDKRGWRFDIHNREDSLCT